MQDIVQDHVHSRLTSVLSIVTTVALKATIRTTSLARHRRGALCDGARLRRVT